MGNTHDGDLAGDERLDDIVTRWSLLRLSHQDSVSRAGPARHALVLRYNRAIRSYIGALTRNDEEADELSQEVIVRLLKGDFDRATPDRGRFRDLLKVAVRNMVRSYWSRKQRRTPAPLDVEQFADEAPVDPADEAWDSTWRDSVLDMAWQALESYEKASSGTVAYTLLRLRTEHPDDDSPQLAARLSAAVGRTFQSPAARQQLRRARLRFAQLLVEELARGLADPAPERVEEELIDLGLMEHVRDFLPPDWRTSGVLRETDAAGGA